jgi:hypothetical protein
LPQANCDRAAAPPDLAFVEGDAEDPATLDALQGPLDYILVLDTIGSLEDCQKFIAQLHPLCTRDTRLKPGLLGAP